MSCFIFQQRWLFLDQMKQQRDGLTNTSCITTVNVVTFYKSVVFKLRLCGFIVEVRDTFVFLNGMRTAFRKEWIHSQWQGGRPHVLICWRSLWALLCLAFPQTLLCSIINLWFIVWTCAFLMFRLDGLT